MHLFDKFPTFVQFVGKAYLNIFTRERILSNRYESNYLIYYYHSILYDPFAISYIAGHKADNEASSSATANRHGILSPLP